jgi:hypothetical protein
MVQRVAVIRKATTPWPLRSVRAYLPDNYEAVEYPDGIVVFGRDVAGWTLDGYVIPRLASGLIFADEVEQPLAAGMYARAVVRAAGEAEEVAAQTTTQEASA